ncbi:hypothetical protein V8F33_007084 [Rhypophila sp. PSN 637]
MFVYSGLHSAATRTDTAKVALLFCFFHGYPRSINDVTKTRSDPTYPTTWRLLPCHISPRTAVGSHTEGVTKARRPRTSDIQTAVIAGVPKAVSIIAALNQQHQFVVGIRFLLQDHGSLFFSEVDRGRPDFILPHANRNSTLMGSAQRLKTTTYVRHFSSQETPHLNMARSEYMQQNVIFLSCAVLGSQLADMMCGKTVIYYMLWPSKSCFERYYVVAAV